MRAGTYHFILDGIVTAKVDVEFELVVRRTGTADKVLTSWSQHFDPLPTGYDAQAYEVDKACPEIDYEAGDELVFIYTASNTTKAEAWIPNGDGAKAKGRIPNITLP